MAKKLDTEARVTEKLINFEKESLKLLLAKQLKMTFKTTNHRWMQLF